MALSAWQQLLLSIQGNKPSVRLSIRLLMSRSIYMQIVPEFSISQEVATLGLSLFVLGLGTSPLFLGPLSEFYGRRPIYLVSFFFFFIWQIPCAFAKNIETILIVRYLAGFSGSAFLSVSGGSISDLFSGPDLTFPMAIFSASPFLGPVMGPLLGDFINQYTTWRWTFRLTMIWSFVIWILLIFAVPETYSPAVLKSKAKTLRRTTGEEKWKAPIEVLDKSLTRTILTNLKRPFILLVEPIVLLLNTWTAILLAILCMYFNDYFGFIVNWLRFILQCVPNCFRDETWLHVISSRALLSRSRNRRSHCGPLDTSVCQDSTRTDCKTRRLARDITYSSHGRCGIRTHRFILVRIHDDFVLDRPYSRWHSIRMCRRLDFYFRLYFSSQELYPMGSFRTRCQLGRTIHHGSRLS